jgi:ketosteroid isomerase-like protein
MKPQHLIEDFLNFYAAKDISALMNMFSKNQALMIMGTILDECYQNHEELKKGFERDFTQLSNLSFQGMEKISILENQEQASVFFQVPISFKAENKMQYSRLRYFFGLVKESNTWKIAQLLVSMPVENTQSG